MRKGGAWTARRRTGLFSAVGQPVPQQTTTVRCGAPTGSSTSTSTTTSTTSTTRP